MAGGPSPTQISDRGPDHDKTPVPQHMQREHISRATSTFKGARNTASRAALLPSLKISQGTGLNPDPRHEGLATKRAAAPNTQNVDPTAHLRSTPKTNPFPFQDQITAQRS